MALIFSVVVSDGTGGIVYEKVGYDRRLAPRKNQEIVTKRHYFLLSIYPLRCTQRNDNERNALISVFKLDFGLSLATGLYVRVTFLNRTAACSRAYSVLIGFF